jgi:mycothiol synthase
MDISLPDGLVMRNPTWDDLQAVADIIVATDLVDRGETDFELEDLATDWKRSAMDLNHDAWVVQAEDGSIVGYEELFNPNQHTQLLGDGYVHPAYQNRGIGTALLRTAHRRAMEHLPLAPADARVYMRNGVSGNDLAGKMLHEQEGYTAVRYFWRMEIEMTAPPEPAVWPEGVHVRPMLPGKDERAVFDALEEGFRGHWGGAHWEYDAWLQRRVAGDNFDPSLWFLAEADGQIAGCAINRYRQEAGWVSQLAVRPAYRRMGLGKALLLVSFDAFFRRGTYRVGLGVDAENATGATRLYMRVGMHVAHEYIAYEKELRPGPEAVTA